MEKETDPARLDLKRRLYQACIGGDMDADEAGPEDAGHVIPINVICDELTVMLAAFIALNPAMQGDAARGEYVDGLRDSIAQMATEMIATDGFQPAIPITMGGNA